MGYKPLQMTTPLFEGVVSTFSLWDCNPFYNLYSTQPTHASEGTERELCDSLRSTTQWLWRFNEPLLQQQPDLDGKRLHGAVLKIVLGLFLSKHILQQPESWAYHPDSTPVALSDDSVMTHHW